MRIKTTAAVQQQQISNGTLRVAMNSIAFAYIRAKAEAKYNRIQGYMKLWSHWMRKCKALKRQLAILANMVHRRLYYADKTMVTFTSLSYTTADVIAAIQDSHRL